MQLRFIGAIAGLATSSLMACSSSPSSPAAGGGGTAGGQAGTRGTGGAAGTGGDGAGGAVTADAGTVDTGSGGAAGGSACPAGVLGHCNSETTAAINAHPGYTLALAEEFDAPIDLDTDPIWTWSDGSPADGQTRFRKSQISFSAGKMIIRAEQPAGCAPTLLNAACIPGGDTTYAEPPRNAATGTIAAMGVWSGEFRSKYNNYRYGYYEARFHAPVANPGFETDNANAGDFLSTMFVFRSPKWQEWNEIDIELEPNHTREIGGNVVNALGQTGYPAGNAAPFESTMGLPANYKISDPHTYAFEWTPTRITWTIDGQVTHTYAGSANDPIPTRSAKIMMNLWIFSGGAFGDGSKNKFPFRAEYDYFRFYKAAPAVDPTYPCAPTPSCLSADDKDFAQNNSAEVSYGR